MDKLTFDQLKAVIDNATERRMAMMVKKNHDYTDGSGDPFANFRASEVLGIDPVLGILLRVQDKMKRVMTFVNRGTLKVDGEGVTDALDDMQNYIDLIRGLFEERNRNVELQSSIRETDHEGSESEGQGLLSLYP